jgi:hypothetical protein
MPLIDLKTNLKSLKYGRDQQGGGSSNQPYIESPIPEGYSPKSIDFLLRNGYLAPLNAGKDIIRLSKMFIDTKSINGPLFILKQNLLSRTSVKPFSSPLINQGSYLPTSTLLQAGSGFLGGHIPHLSLPDRLKYYDFTKNLNETDKFYVENRLLALRLTKIKNNTDPLLTSYYRTNNIPVGKGTENSILSYSGGPGSIGGIGNTTIKFASERTGINNSKINYYEYKNFIEGQERSAKTNDRTKLEWIIPTTKGASGKYIDYKKLPFFNNKLLFIEGEPVLFEGSFEYVQNWNNKTTKSGSLDPISNLLNYQSRNKLTGNKDSLSQNQFPYATSQFISDSTINGGVSFIYSSSYGLEIDKGVGDKNKIYPNQIPFSLKNPNKDVIQKNNTNYFDFTSIEPFSKTGKVENVENFLTFTSSPYTKHRNYLNNTSRYSGSFKETKYSLGDPGSKTRKSLIEADSLNYKFNISSSYALDKLAALGISEERNDKDIIDFKIQVKGGKFLIFRAFLESFNDNYSAEWDSVKYVGRGENFYSYTGFNRDISLSFNVFAQSKGELKAMYDKLNYLASITAPSYTGKGFMKGNIIELTVGNYIKKQSGILKQLNYEISLEAGWDIEPKIQMPHFIKVGTFSFIPIHEFVPTLHQRYFGVDEFENYNYSPPPVV